MTPYVIADDLSGALETGAAFRAGGWKAVLPLQPMEVPAGTLRVLSSETRNRKPAEAAAILGELVRGEQANGGTLLFKKIDSTLRGPIGAEIDALRAALAPKLIVLCPANPVAGRTIRDGTVRVHGVPLVATDFHDDPYWPASTSSALEILAGQGMHGVVSLPLADVRKGAAHLAATIRAAAGRGASVVLADAELQSDLPVIAEAGAAAGAQLFVGSGGFAEAVAARLPAPAKVAAPKIPAEFASMLVICGSRSSMSHRQISQLAKKKSVRVLQVSPPRVDPAAVAKSVRDELAARRIAVVQFSVPPKAGDKAASQLIAGVEAVARVLARETSPAVYFLTGGETAWTVCQALAGVSLEIVAEAEPGVVLAVLHRGAAPDQFVITKPGGFGQEGLLLKIASLVK